MRSHIQNHHHQQPRASLANHLFCLISGVALLALTNMTLAQTPPTEDTKLAPAQSSFNLPQPHRLIPEETFVVAREATITPAGETGAWIVTFENKAGQGILPPMFLMPSRRLQRLESALAVNAERSATTSAAKGAMLNAIVSGQIFAYRKYNFLMLTAMPRFQAPASTATTDTTSVTKQSGEGAETSTPTAADVSEATANASADVEAMIKELETGGPMAPILRRSAADPGDRQTTRQPRPAGTRKSSNKSHSGENTLLEGAFVMNRAARLIRSTDSGAWAIVFDSDDTGLVDAPLIVLPCKMLEQMEARAEQVGDTFRLNVSGQIYTYQGGTYLLPTLMQIPYKRDNLSP